MQDQRAIERKIGQLKYAIRTGKTVDFSGSDYIPKNLILGWIFEDWQYSVELQDMRADSRITVPVRDITIKEAPR